MEELKSVKKTERDREMDRKSLQKKILGLQRERDKQKEWGKNEKNQKRKEIGIERDFCHIKQRKLIERTEDGRVRQLRKVKDGERDINISTAKHRESVGEYWVEKRKNERKMKKGNCERCLLHLCLIGRNILKFLEF